jgi:hypothetical protein
MDIMLICLSIYVWMIFMLIYPCMFVKCYSWLCLVDSYYLCNLVSIHIVHYLVT